MTDLNEARRGLAKRLWELWPLWLSAGVVRIQQATILSGNWVQKEGTHKEGSAPRRPLTFTDVSSIYGHSLSLAFTDAVHLPLCLLFVKKGFTLHVLR